MDDTELTCRECGRTATWGELKGSTVPEEDGSKLVEKVACPRCGNDTFDREESDG